MSWNVRRETRADAASVESLVARVFGAGRYAKTAYRLREGVEADTRLSFVAEANGDLLGSVRFWPIRIGGRLSLLLGPLAVRPELRGRGIGIALMQRGIEEAQKLGYETMVLVGDEPYYARVGFARLKPRQIRFPGPVNPERVLGLGLKPGALESLEGPVARARLDVAVAAHAVGLGGVN